MDRITGPLHPVHKKGRTDNRRSEGLKEQYSGDLSRYPFFSHPL